MPSKHDSMDDDPQKFLFNWKATLSRGLLQTMQPARRGTRQTWWQCRWTVVKQMRLCAQCVSMPLQGEWTGGAFVADMACATRASLRYVDQHTTVRIGCD